MTLKRIWRDATRQHPQGRYRLAAPKANRISAWNLGKAQDDRKEARAHDVGKAHYVVMIY